MSTSGSYNPPAAAAENFFRSANVTAKPDGVADITDAIVHQGKVAIGPFNADPIALLDVTTQGRSGVDGRTANTMLYATAGLPGIATATTTPAAMAEIRHFSQSQGVGFAFDGLYATGDIATQSLTLMQRGAGFMRKIWQAATTMAENTHWNQATPAVGTGIQNRILMGTAPITAVANHYEAVVETVAPLNVRQQFDIVSNGILSGAIRIQPNMAALGNTTLYVGEQQIHNRKIVLWENGATDTDKFFGFGINGGTLRYQLSDTNQFNRWYAWSAANTSQMIFSVSGVGNVTVDPAGLNNGGFSNGMLRFGGETSQTFISSKRTAGGNQNDLELGTSAIVRITVKVNGTLNFSNVPTFATDALAGTGGLVTGDVYKTAAGALQIKL